MSAIRAPKRSGNHLQQPQPSSDVHVSTTPFHTTNAGAPGVFGGVVFNPAVASAGLASGAPTAQSSSNRRYINVNKASPGSTDSEGDFRKRTSFLSGFFVAFKEQIHTDILLKPNNGPSIPAHKALLAARSEIFKNILDSDACKAPASDKDIITLSELNTEELESFLEFLYIGNLPTDKWNKHVYSLYVAADKYEIPYLMEKCERYLLDSLNVSNALDVLEVSDAHSNMTMKEAILKFIVANMRDIVSTNKYEDFASTNPNLCVQITRSYVKQNVLYLGFSN